jgi:integral membrane protein
MTSTVKAFTTIAVLEAISYILLLGIAMPMKYWLGMPLAVKIVGWAHGLLFVGYVFLLVLCWFNYRWSFKRVLMYFVASLLPFLPFFVERSLKKEYQL